MGANRISHQRPVPRPAVNRPHRTARLGFSRSSQPKTPRPSFKGSWQQFCQKVLQSPKTALEGELTVAVVGLVIAFMGSLITAGGWYFSGSTRSGVIAGQGPPAGPEPILGTIVFFVGVG